MQRISRLDTRLTRAKKTLNPMSGFTSEPLEEQFYWDTKYLTEYLAASKSNRQKLPGHSYYSKVEKFIEQHFEIGELYMEYVKCACQASGEKCKYCTEHPWIGPEISRVPRPQPADGELLPLSATPLTMPDGTKREVDDYQPRAQLRKYFAVGLIKSENADQVLDFCRSFAVEEKLVRQQLTHFEYLHFKQQKRMKQRQKQKQNVPEQKFADIDWEAVYTQRKIKTLKVVQLNLYIREKKLCIEMNAKKAEKVSLIEANIAKEIAMKLCHEFHGKKNPQQSDSDSDLESENESEVEEITLEDTENDSDNSRDRKSTRLNSSHT